MSIFLKSLAIGLAILGMAVFGYYQVRGGSNGLAPSNASELAPTPSATQMPPPQTPSPDVSTLRGASFELIDSDAKRMPPLSPFSRKIQLPKVLSGYMAFGVETYADALHGCHGEVACMQSNLQFLEIEAACDKHSNPNDKKNCLVRLFTGR